MPSHLMIYLFRFAITTAGLTYESPVFASVLLVKIFVFILPITVLCQFVITLRVWFLYPRNLVVKILAVALMLSTATASALISASHWTVIRAESLNPLAPTSRALAWIYVPSLVIHSVLFGLKVFRFLSSSVRNQSDSLLWGFVKEYELASLSFGVAGLTMVEPSQLTVSYRSPIPVVTFIILSVCRTMISIRSVAATAHVDPEWLLNYAELSRVRWRWGSVDGELIVEADRSTTPRSIEYFRMK
ncbi:hypothetical protein JVU11DRAFT_6442 [Chiua virens]|nr:hypothetical protein JVU11DRAFT_6442 [Chiua virens]